MFGYTFAKISGVLDRNYWHKNDDVCHPDSVMITYTKYYKSVVMLSSWDWHEVHS
jgi:hypothetical protein